MLRSVGIALVLVAALGCGGISAACPAGDVCTPIDGGATQEGGSIQDGGATSESGPTTIATQIQLAPTCLASDGTTLFWVSPEGPGGPLSSMPVGGGTISTVVPGPTAGGFLAVDAVNVYYLNQMGTPYRAPKGGGGTPALISEANAVVGAVTALGTTAYWVEPSRGGPPMMGPVTVKSAPLPGGAVSVIAQFPSMSLGGGMNIGVTTTTAFLSENPMPLFSFSLSTGIPDGGTPSPVPGLMQGCQYMVSDTDAVYCEDGNAALARIASDGTSTMLGSVVDESGTSYGGGFIAFDDANVYWVDDATVGTIMKVPKTGGTPAIIARDTNPIAIAVDANWVFWSDKGGNIMRLAK